MSARYDRAITIFSPDGHLFQVEYALEAVRKGTLAIGVKGSDIIALGIEKKAIPKLQDSRTVRKIVKIDDHITLAFAGLVADARILINRARIQSLSTELQLDEKISVDALTKYVAGLQQKFTQSSGVRPFGISTLIVGFDPEGEPKLYQTDPSGTYASWKATSIGRNSKAVQEYLEKNYKETSGKDTIKIALKALLETVEPGSKSIELAVMEKDTGLRVLSDEEVDALVAEVEREKAEADSARRGGIPAAAAAGPST